MEAIEQGKPTLTARRRGSVGMSVLCLNSIEEIHAAMQIAARPGCTVMPWGEIVPAPSEMSHWRGITWHCDKQSPPSRGGKGT
jgi:hypothetical protein